MYASIAYLQFVGNICVNRVLTPVASSRVFEQKKVVTVNRRRPTAEEQVLNYHEHADVPVVTVLGVDG